LPFTKKEDKIADKEVFIWRNQEEVAAHLPVFFKKVNEDLYQLFVWRK